MTKERMIEILAEVCEIEQRSLSADGRLLIMVDEALTAMQRAVDEETATIRAELERLKGIIDNVKQLDRYDVDVECYGDDGCSLSVYLDSYGRWVEYDELAQWVKDNPK